MFLSRIRYYFHNNIKHASSLTLQIMISKTFQRITYTYIHVTSVNWFPIEKKPLSAFARFVRLKFQDTVSQDRFAENKEIMRIIANKWKVLSLHKKTKFMEEFKKEQRHWKEVYDNATPEERKVFEELKLKRKRSRLYKIENKKKQKNDEIKYPYRKINSFMIFNYERYPVLKRKYNNLKQQEIIKLLTYEWKILSNDDKSRYQKMATNMRKMSTDTTITYTFLELYDDCYESLKGEDIYY